MTPQLYGLVPEFVRIWSDVVQPSPLAVLRTGLTPYEIAALPLAEFMERVRAHRQGRRLWRGKLRQVHEHA